MNDSTIKVTSRPGRRAASVIMKIFPAFFLWLCGTIGLHAGAVALNVENIGAVRFFAGSPAELTLAVEAPVGASVDLEADVAQVAGGIAATLESGVGISKELRFADRTRQVIRASVPLPAMRGGQLLVRFTAREGTSRKVVGQTSLFIYPDDGMKNLRVFFAALEERQSLRLGVFGASPRLREFLRAQKIPFEDCGGEVPERFEKTLVYAGEGKAEIADRFAANPDSKAVLFLADAALIPGVYRTVRAGGFLTKVTLPLPGLLSADPQAQQTFAEIFYQALPDQPAPQSMNP
jgi:hypothetical protein